MRTGKWSEILAGACSVLAAVGIVAGAAHADVTTEKGSSILVFPKVRADSQFDTVIEITNTSNSMTYAQCYYVNDYQSWSKIDFHIWLTKQQPTQWVVSSGRRFDPSCGFGASCSGFAPGFVPPLPEFEGELKCIQTNENGDPIKGNHLKGVATLVAVSTSGADARGLARTEGDIASYNAVGIRGTASQVVTNPLLLDGNQYEACPAQIILDHVASGATDPISGGTVYTELTLVPCSQDFENAQSGVSTIQFVVYNEYEQRFSASTTVDCFLNVEVAGIDTTTTPANSVFSRNVLGTDVASAVITPVPGHGGLIGVAERVTVLSPGVVARSAYNLHTQGSLVPSTGPDSIRLIEPF